MNNWTFEKVNDNSLSKETNTDAEILTEVRDILLPLVNPVGNSCRDMEDCTTSSKECVKCLAERISEQYLKMEQELKDLKK